MCIFPHKDSLHNSFSDYDIAATLYSNNLLTVNRKRLIDQIRTMAPVIKDTLPVSENYSGPCHKQ